MDRLFPASKMYLLLQNKVFLLLVNYQTDGEGKPVSNRSGKRAGDVKTTKQLSKCLLSSYTLHADLVFFSFGFRPLSKWQPHPRIVDFFFFFLRTSS